MAKTTGFHYADGFAVTTAFYDSFINHNGLDSETLRLLDTVDYSDIKSIQTVTGQIRDLINAGKFTNEMTEAVATAYISLSERALADKLSLAVRSSAVAEDLEDASFAGQQDTYLNITGVEAVLESIKRCMASLFNAQVVSYRKTHNIPWNAVKLSVGIQQMVRSDLGSSGVAFSLDPESGYRNVVVINSLYGLGELAVGGQVIPDEFVVDKRIYATNPDLSIVSTVLGQKDRKMIYARPGSGKTTAVVETTQTERHQLSLTHQQTVELAGIVNRLEQYYRQITNSEMSVDVEWALDPTGIYVVQTRPETVHSSRKRFSTVCYEQYTLTSSDRPAPIVSGIAVGNATSRGTARRLESIDECDQFQDGDILVIEMTTPDWEPVMKRSSGIITDKGSRTCHAAIIARELGVNALVGTVTGTRDIASGTAITLSCSEGETGYVYPGLLSYTRECIEVEPELVDKLPVRLMLNVGNPCTAYRNAVLPNRGVGLTRMEFTINSFIGIHPLALLNFNSLDHALKSAITTKMAQHAHSDPIRYFVDQLANGLGKIASAFYPNEVIIRFSDFKSNEYRNLLGGDRYEPVEENPMLGWRGCSRYYSDAYQPAFALECQAIRRLRYDMGLDNVTVMLPFCRTPEECRRVQKVMIDHGLSRDDGLRVFLMCEIPSNVIEAEEFSRMIDGVSIGGNDLFQLTLGLDRDCSLEISDHTNGSFRWMVGQAIERYHRYGVKVGFCGQQPSESVDFCQFLIDCGIDSISVTPDTVVKTLKRLVNK